MSYNEESLVRLRHLETALQKVKESLQDRNPPYKFGHGLKQEGVTVSVNSVDDFSGDNTLPMTAAGVYASVGNIEALLETI